jgi:hypothetical protein
MTRRFLALLLVLTLCQFGCYNTYRVALPELSKAQEGGQTAAVQLETASKEKVAVSKNTKIGVIDTDGKLNPISPFNFTLSKNQLIAPDEDLLVPRSAIESGYVKQISTGKTLLVVLTGLGAIVGGGLYIMLTAEEKKSFGQ